MRIPVLFIALLATTLQAQPPVRPPTQPQVRPRVQPQAQPQVQPPAQPQAQPQPPADSLLRIRLNNGTLSLQGYVDVYFSYALSHPLDATHPYFVSYSRDNEINLDLAYLSVKYASDRLRATFTPGYGTYMNANYASERQTLQNILEAYAGIRVFRNKAIWLDAGVFNSPYTNEEIYSFDQLTYTRSIGADNTPYYLTGARLTVPLTDKWTATLYLLNGWQVIEAQHDPLDFGSQLEFKPNGKWDINWNTYLGNESSKTNPNYKTRYFTDLYGTYSPSANWTFSADAYIGWQEKHVANDLETRQWWNANVCARYTFIPGNSLSLRLEEFHDPYQILVKPVTNARGFRLASASLGYDRSITRDALLRFEARYFHSPADIYPLRERGPVNNDLWLTVGLTAVLR